MDLAVVACVVVALLAAFYVGWRGQRDKMESFVSQKAMDVYKGAKTAFDSGKTSYGDFKKAVGQVAGGDTDAVLHRNLHAAHRIKSLTPELVQGNLLS